jgi:hypothetical protein
MQRRATPPQRPRRGWRGGPGRYVVGLLAASLCAACAACGAAPSESAGSAARDATPTLSASPSPQPPSSSSPTSQAVSQAAVATAGGAAAATQPSRRGGAPACVVGAGVRQEWDEGFAAVAARYSGTLGIAIALPDGGPVLTWGPLQQGPAWSTSKVPLAIAVTRADGGTPSPADDVNLRAAIGRSDNGAAQALWDRLGGGAAGAAAMTAVLADGANASTLVPDRPLRPGYSVFGQTNWTLRDQAIFARQLPGLQGAAPTVTAMAAITADQRWGLGRHAAVPAFKGGWGPDPEGSYLVRQFGLLRLPSGRVAGVAVAARSAAGFQAGIAGVDLAANHLVTMLSALPSDC